MLKKLLLPTLVLTLLTGKIYAQSLDNMFAKPTSMTDEQAKAAQEFNHEGMKARVVKEACEKDKSLKDSKCDESQIDANGDIFKGSFGAGLEQHIGKLYGVLFGAGFLTGSGPKVTVKDGKGTVLDKTDKSDLKKNGTTTATGKDGKPKAEKQNDYCIYGALGYELIAGMMQASQQKQMNNTEISDPQLQALVSLKQAHKTRKRTALYQAVIYDATLACYVARLTGVMGGGQVVADFTYWAKMSGAAVLAGLYHIKSAKHAKAEKAVQTVIDSLPKTGECNPWTGTACFCKEESSKTLYAGDYQEVCVLNKGDSTTPLAALGCGVLKNGVMSYDKDCACKKNNTCFKALLTAYNPSFSLGANMMNDTNKGYDILSSGNFDQGKFDAYSLSAGVNAKRIGQKVVPNEMPKLTLNDAQKKDAEDLKSLGALGNVVAASNSFSPPGGGFMGESTNAKIVALTPEVQKKLDFGTNSAYKSGSGFSSENFSEPEAISLPSMTGEAQTDNSTEVISFAEKAINQADVTKSEETPIFDIISHRYRASGWGKLQAAEK